MLNKNISDYLKETVNRKEKFNSAEDLNYLYPNGHRMTHQMKWFKGSRGKGLTFDIAA